MKKNLDTATVQGFGDEWSRFDQSQLSNHEKSEIFQQYFGIFPWGQLPKNAVGFDLGCGSGRWASVVAEKVGKLHCIDPSQAIEVAKRNLSKLNNCEFHQKSVDEIPLPDGSMDFCYSLGVLHHVPNTFEGILKCSNKLKKGAPFLIYLYYAFDNKSFWYRLIWKISETIRFVVSRLPHTLRYLASQIIALLVYFPLAKTAAIFNKLGINTQSFPLSYYKDRSFYTMRTDALDRFGTQLEQRFSKIQIQKMMEDAGLENIRFSNHAPFWCALGYKK